MVWLPNSRVEAHVDAQVALRSHTVNTPQGKIRRNQRDLVVLQQIVTPNETQLILLWKFHYAEVQEFLILLTDSYLELTV